MAKKARRASKPRYRAVAVTMTRGTKPTRRGKVLRAASGYKLKKVGRSSVALMRGNVKTANFTCECNESGGCRVEMDGPSAMCLENGCTGACGWVVNVPGIYGGLSAVLAKR